MGYFGIVTISFNGFALGVGAVYPNSLVKGGMLEPIKYFVYTMDLTTILNQYHLTNSYIFVWGFCVRLRDACFADRHCGCIPLSIDYERSFPKTRSST